MFNTFNDVNLRQPNATVDSPTAGQIFSIASLAQMRNWQSDTPREAGGLMSWARLKGGRSKCRRRAKSAPIPFSLNISVCSTRALLLAIYWRKRQPRAQMLVGRDSSDNL